MCRSWCSTCWIYLANLRIYCFYLLSTTMNIWLILLKLRNVFYLLILGYSTLKRWRKKTYVIYFSIEVSITVNFFVHLELSEYYFHESLCDSRIVHVFKVDSLIEGIYDLTPILRGQVEKISRRRNKFIMSCTYTYHITIMFCKLSSFNVF